MQTTWRVGRGVRWRFAGEEELEWGFPSAAEAKVHFLTHAHPCPICRMAAGGLAWVYVILPPAQRMDDERREGWLTICPRCNRQIDFFPEPWSFLYVGN